MAISYQALNSNGDPGENTPSQPLSDRYKPGTGVHVATLTSNLILESGLGSILQALDNVASVRHFRPSDGVSNGLAQVAILICTKNELSAMPSSTQEMAMPKILLLLDGGDSDCLDVPFPIDGFLVQQDLTAEVLQDALTRIVDGEVPMPAQVARTLLTRAVTPRPRAIPRAVTPRERETLQLIALGMTNRQIARRLGISEHGAKRLVASVLLKLGSPNRTTAVVTALREQLIDMS